MFGSNVITENFMSKIADGVEMYQDHLQNASKVMLGPLETTISTTPYDIVYEEDRIRLKHYTPDKNATSRVNTPLLITYALINRETMLDLQPDRSVIRSLLADGIEVYMIDWGYPSRKDRYLTIDDHVSGYMNNVVDFIRKRHQVQKISLMGICMGGTFSTMYSALYPEKIKNLITTVTPTSFDTRDGLLHSWTQGIDADKMVETFGNIPADLMNFGFLLLNPARLMVDKYKSFMDNMSNKTYVENFVRMEKWIFDSPDVPGETFRQFIKDCYQKNLLIQNKMEIGGKRIDLKKITMPLLNIFSKYDHLVPPAASNQLTSQVGSTDKEDVCLATGHIGIYVSSRFQKEFAPRISMWLSQRDQIEERKLKAVKPKLVGKAVAKIVKDPEKKPFVPSDIPTLPPNSQQIQSPAFKLKQA